MAEFFGKEHKNVLQAIRDLISETPALSLNFQPIDVEVEVGFGVRKFPTFDMDQKGFTMLAFGFTGAKANHFKLLYIDAFSRHPPKAAASAVRRQAA